jgi:hypothetical protein
MSSPNDAYSRQKVEEYRQRAENARGLAEKMTDPDRRRAMLKAADTWERMAKWEEEYPSRS